MIIDGTDNALSRIKNPDLRSYASMYVNIYKDFLENIANSGIEIDPQDYSSQAEEKKKTLRKRGAIVRNDGKGIYINNISPACVACRKGVGSATFFISLQCHRDCFYCFNPNQENYDYYQHNTRNAAAELEQLKSYGQRVQYLGLTGGEPLLHKHETIEFFENARDKFPDAHTRLYTCGDHADKKTLQKLKNAGLQEIRFSIRMHDLASNHRHIYDRIALAREFLPTVMVEMPILPDTWEEMKEVLQELDRLRIFSINLLELCYPLTNAAVYEEKGFKIKARPLRVLYDYWYSGGLPISRSELLCLDLIEFALDSELSLGVHYCSVENKHTRQVFQQNSNGSIPKVAHLSQKDFFLKTAKVFGEDVSKVKAFFDRKGMAEYQVNGQHDYLEFHVGEIKSLSYFDIEVGISSNVLENRDGEVFIRELKVDVTTPKIFGFSDDI